MIKIFNMLLLKINNEIIQEHLICISKKLLNFINKVSKRINLPL